MPTESTQLQGKLDYEVNQPPKTKGKEVDIVHDPVEGQQTVELGQIIKMVSTEPASIPAVAAFSRRTRPRETRPTPAFHADPPPLEWQDD